MKHIRSLILALVLSAGLAAAFAQAPPPVPALPDAERRTSYVISASTCNCSVGMQLYQDGTDYANWLTVYINGVQIPQSGNWTITSPSGSIATLPRPITNAVLTFTTAQTGTVQIVGAQRPRRLSEYTENRGVAARDLNQTMNGIEAQLREMWDRQFRTVQAPPGETLSLLPPLSGRANMGACFDASGNLAPCLAAGSGTFVAGNGINFTGTGPTTISTATYSAGNGIVFNGTNPTTISVSSSSGTPLIPTRAVAATLNLSAYSVIQTGGYTTGGDGGHAMFKNVGSAPFIDSYITTFTITGGSAYTNGSFFGVIWTVGSKPLVIGTATVAGGVVTAVNVQYTPGNQCAIGDVLTTGSLAGGTGASITVTGCSTPLASFTDSVGTRFQFVPTNWPNVLQFGAIGDWNGVDASATDNFNAIQAAYWFATFKSSTSYDAGGYWGNRVTFPAGSFMACGTGLRSLVVPHGVQSWGAGGTASEIRFCNAFDGSTVLIELGDPNWHFSCFQSSLWHMAVASQGAGTAFGLHSNCGQDFSGVYHSYFFLNGSSRRGCIHYEKGYGGASWWGVINASCNAISNGPQIQIGNTVASGLNLGNTNVSLHNIVMGGPSSGPNLQTGPGIQVYGGNTNMMNVHGEAMPTVVQLDVAATANSETQWLQNINGGGGPIACTGVVTLTANNNPGNAAFSQFPSQGSCAHTITNGQSGGASFDGRISKPISCVSGACS